MNDEDQESCRNTFAESSADNLSASSFGEDARVWFATVEAYAARAEGEFVGAGEGCHETTPKLPARDTPPITRYCHRCGHTMLLREFEYFLTGAEATRRGYAQNKRVKIEGNICRGCRPKRKPLSALNAKELHNRVATGDLHPMLAAGQTKKREQRAYIARVKGQVDRWRDDLKRMWSPVLDGVSEEQRRVLQALKYLKHPPRTPKTPRDADADERLLAFYTDYYDVLRALKNRIKLTYILNDRRKFWPPRPDGTQAKVLTEREFAEAPPVLGLDLAHWACFIPPQEWAQLVGQWQGLPAQVHASPVRVPPIMSRRTGYFGEDET